MVNDSDLTRTFEKIDNPYTYQNDISIEHQNEKLLKEKNVLPPTKNLSVNLIRTLNRREQAEHIIDIQPCYYDRARNWWLWNHRESKWERVDEVDILNSVERQTDGLSTINAKERSEIIEALKQVSRLNKPKEINPLWVQFKNEIIDIKTGEIKRATPEFFVTNPIPWAMNKDKFADTPTMDRIFEEWVGKENAKQLYEILAYCCLPDYPLHRIFCFIGSGMNGKSKFLELLKRFVGESNCVSTELEDLIKNRFEKTKLHKKLVCMMGETNFNRMDKTSMVKKLSGGDLIGFEYKNKDLFDDKNYAKLLIATNNLPSTDDKSVGFYRRWQIIDFPNQFTEAKDILSEVPEEEYEALALKCTFILKDLIENRKFTNEGTLEERKEKYESKSDFLQKFINDFVIEKLDGYITKNDFYKKFDSWRRENRHRELSEMSLALSMKKKGFESGRQRFEWLNDGRGGQARVWKGIVWKNQ